MASRTKRRTTRRQPQRASSRSRARTRRPRPRADPGAGPRRARFSTASSSATYDLAGLALIAARHLHGVRHLPRLERRARRRLARDRSHRCSPAASPTWRPLALAGWGVALIMRPGREGAVGAERRRGSCCSPRCCSRSPRAPRASGPTHPVRHGYFNHHFMTQHGGAGGEALYWASTTLFQRLGAHILDGPDVRLRAPPAHRDARSPASFARVGETAPARARRAPA